MDFNDTPEEAAFRKEVRTWLDANATRKSDDSKSFRARNDDPNLLKAAKEWQSKKADRETDRQLIHGDRKAESEDRQPVNSGQALGSFLLTGFASKGREQAQGDQDRGGQVAGGVADGSAQGSPSGHANQGGAGLKGREKHGNSPPLRGIDSRHPQGSADDEAVNPQWDH